MSMSYDARPEETGVWCSAAALRNRDSLICAYRHVLHESTLLPVTKYVVNQLPTTVVAAHDPCYTIAAM